MDQKIIDLYDDFTHDRLSRRAFIKKLSTLVGGTAAAYSILPLLKNNYAQAAIISETDPRLEIATTTFPGVGTSVSGYLAKPKGGKNLPSVVVIHENRGLNPHIKDIARRLAAEGFLALAPDMLSPVGGTPGDEDKARTMIRALDKAATLKHLLGAVPFLAAHKDGSGKVGCIGFCWGGAMANNMAVNSADLKGAVAYYGRQPKAPDVAKIKARLLLHYGGLDKRINAGIADFEAALKAAKVNYQKHVYDGANHAFNNDTNAARYNPEAATLSWGRTVAFLKETLA